MSNKKIYFKYLKLTMLYANNKIWYLLLLALVPSVLISFIFSPYGSLKFLINFANYADASYLDIYRDIIGINYSLFWLGLIGALIVPIFLAVLFGAVERHMRIGEFNLGFDRIRPRLNYNFTASLKFCCTLFVIYQVGKFLQSIMFYTFNNVFDGDAALTLCIIWYVLMFLSELFVFSSIIIWVPTMLQTGLSSAKAFGLSIRQGLRYSVSTMFLMLMPTLFIMVLMIINCIYNLHINIVLDTILLTYTFIFYVILMYTMFFDINGIEREDLKKVNIWKKKRRD